MAGFEKIPGLAPDLDRVQANIQAALAAIPAPAAFNAVSVSKDYTATGSEGTIHVDASRGNVRVTLPPTSAGNPPLTIQQINKAGTFGTVTIVAAKAAKTISGANSIALDASGTGSVTLTCDGVSWWPSSGGALVPVPSPNQPIPPQSGAGVLTVKPPLLGGGPMSKNITLELQAATETQDGYLSASDKIIIDNLATTFPPIGRTINTTAPLTGGGPLTADLTLAIAANGIDGSLFRQSAAASLVGNPSGSTADVSDITLGAGLAFDGSTLVNTAPADHKVSIDGSDTSADYLAAKLTATAPVTLTVTGGGTPAPPSSGLALWLKGDAGVTLSGSDVTGWADQSGNGNDVTAPGTPPTINASAINGLPGVTFDAGVSTALTNVVTSILTSGSDRHIIVVSKPSNATGGTLIAFRSSIPDSTWDVLTIGNQYWWSDSVSIASTVPAVDYTGTPIATEFTGQVGLPAGVTINASPITLSVADNVTAETGTDGFSIGDRPAAVGQGFYGDICEILVYDHILSGPDLDQVRAYLQGRYAISLGAGGGGGGSETLVAALSFDTSLAVSGGALQRAALSGDVAAAAGSNTLTIQPNVVTYAQMQQGSAATLLGNPTGSLADISEITLGAGLTFTGTTLVNTLTAGTGITFVGGTAVTADLSTGISGGQSVIGGAGPGENLTLSSTADATKGLIYIGSSFGVFDEAQGKGAFGQTTTDAGFHFVTADDTSPPFIPVWDDRHTVFGLSGDQGAGVGFSYSSSTNTENINFAEPNIAWVNARFNAATFDFYSGGLSLGFSQDASANVSIGTLGAGGIVLAAPTSGQLGLVTIGTGLDLTAGVLSSTVTGGITELTGDVTAGPGSGSQVATIGAHKVTYGQMQQASTHTLLGNPTTSTADVEEVSVGTGLAFVGVGVGLFALENTSPLSDLSANVPLNLSGNVLTAPGVLYTNTGPSPVDLGALSSGILKQSVSGGAATISIAVAGTDYEAPITWPVSPRVLISGGISATPVGDSTFTFDSTNHGLAAGNFVGINGVVPASNLYFAGGNATNTDRAQAAFFVGGSSIPDNPDNSLFLVSQNSGVHIPAGRTTGIWATARIQANGYSGISSPTITEAATLYIDGAPSLTGATGSTWAMHVASGSSFFEGLVEVAPPGGYLFVISPTIGMYFVGDGGAGAGLTALNQTTGFVYIPTTGGGTPTGTPANIGSRAGATPMVYDQTGDHLYIWNPSTHLWKVH